MQGTSPGARRISSAMGEVASVFRGRRGASIVQTGSEPENIQPDRLPRAWRLLFLFLAALLCWVPILACVWFFLLRHG